jgi:hypothetical protein
MKTTDQILPEEGQAEAMKLIEGFKTTLAKAVEEVLGSLYVEVMPYIESDSWANFRNHVVEGLRDYPNAKISRHYDFKKIRAKMFEEHREEIIGDLNADLLAEVAALKEEIRREREIQGRRAY